MAETYKKCSHIVKRVYTLEVSDLSKGVFYVILQCMVIECGQLTIRKIDPKEKGK